MTPAPAELMQRAEVFLARFEERLQLMRAWCNVIALTVILCLLAVLIFSAFQTTVLVVYLCTCPLYCIHKYYFIYRLERVLDEAAPFSYQIKRDAIVRYSELDQTRSSTDLTILLSFLSIYLYVAFTEFSLLSLCMAILWLTFLVVEMLKFTPTPFWRKDREIQPLLDAERNWQAEAPETTQAKRLFDDRHPPTTPPETRCARRRA